MPSSSDAALDDVHLVMQEWRQGDLLPGEDIPLVYLADNRLVAVGHPLPGVDGLHVRERLVDTLAVVTQTCDIVRHPRERPFLHLAPVLRLEGDAARNARRGSIPRFVPLPAVGSDLFVDLDLVITIEKSAVYRCSRELGVAGDQGRRDFAERLGRNISRPALPDDFNSAMSPFVKSVRGKHQKEHSDLGALFRDLYSIRVRSEWSESEAATIYLLFDSDSEHFPVIGDEPPVPSAVDADWWQRTERSEADVASRIVASGSDASRHWLWQRLMEIWASKCSAGAYEVSFEVLRLDEMSAREWLSSDPLDLDHLSVDGGDG